MLAATDLHTLEHYARIRNDFRAEMRAYKKNRQVAIGDHATLYFEDQRTIQYQIQEILRAERIFEPAAIAEELDAYNPLIPDGDNWKATFMLEYESVDERRAALNRLIGIEDQVWVKIGTHPPIYAIANEDLPRSTGTKTSAVHFLRFPLNPHLINTVKEGATLIFGISHPAYIGHTIVTAATQQALQADLRD